MPPPSKTIGNDRPIWRLEQSGACSIKSAYHSIHNEYWNAAYDKWMIPGSLTAPKGFANSYGSSSTIDFLRMRKGSVGVLPMMIGVLYVVSRKKRFGHCGVQLRHLFGVLIWKLWKIRNEFVFNGQIQLLWKPSTRPKLGLVGSNKVIYFAHEGFGYQQKAQELWRPSFGCIMLNTDGAVNSEPRRRQVAVSSGITMEAGTLATVETLGLNNFLFVMAKGFINVGSSPLPTPATSEPPPNKRPPSTPTSSSSSLLSYAPLFGPRSHCRGPLRLASSALRRRLASDTPASSPSDPPANKGLKKKILKSLPKDTFSADFSAKFSDCAICLTEFVAGDEIRVLPQCGHGFHVACIDTWLGSHSSCPSCRQILGVARCHKCGGFSGSGASTSGTDSELD
ncbi:RING-H2 finger protein ATL8 [Hibiscus syriacus]|uniref:RING-H2 finger protein ATL8 n=1 Tax=Hibiscus syriacus TaxID=106335 RepID=A0A6A3CW67_HIBSY|nr:RING-H2 finger protein ATL8 [Hibiscus syriacus]